MITVIVNIDLYRYEIHSLLKAFYPREDVKVLTEADAAGSRKYQQIAREPFLRVVFAEKNITLSFCDGSDQRAAPVPGDLPADRKSQELKTLLDGYKDVEMDEKTAFRMVMDQLNADADIIACKKEYMRVFKNYLTPEQLSKVFIVEKFASRPRGPKGGPGAPDGQGMPPMGPPPAGAPMP